LKIDDLAYRTLVAQESQIDPDYYKKAYKLELEVFDVINYIKKILNE